MWRKNIYVTYCVIYIYNYILYMYIYIYIHIMIYIYIHTYKVGKHGLANKSLSLLQTDVIAPAAISIDLQLKQLQKRSYFVLFQSCAWP